MNRSKYGKEVCKRLVDMDKQKVWLMEEIRKRTGLYMDSSYLNKILNSGKGSQKVLDAIHDTIGVRPE